MTTNARSNRSDRSNAEAVAVETTATAAPTAIPTERRGVLSVDTSGHEIRIEWADGSVRLIGLDRLSEEIRDAAMRHGLRQKIADAAAMSRNPETGKPASILDKRARVNSVVDNLINGHWTAPTRAGSGETSLRSRVVEAIRRMNQAKSSMAVEEALAAKSTAEINAMAAVPRVASVIAEIKRERMGEAASAAESALDELIG